MGKPVLLFIRFFIYRFHHFGHSMQSDCNCDGLFSTMCRGMCLYLNEKKNFVLHLRSIICGNILNSAYSNLVEPMKAYVQKETILSIVILCLELSIVCFYES